MHKTQTDDQIISSVIKLFAHSRKLGSQISSLAVHPHGYRRLMILPRPYQPNQAEQNGQHEIMGFPLIEDPSLPEDTCEIRHKGKVLGKIVNLTHEPLITLKEEMNGKHVSEQKRDFPAHQ